MNLIIDQGNTRAKLALFEGNALTKKESSADADRSTIGGFIGDLPITGVILSSVKETPSGLEEYLSKLSSHFVKLSHTTALPFSIEYRTPHTLGRDRIAAVAGAFFEHPHRNSLVIDAGTAITYDLIDANGIYKGGNIAPGLEMRLKSLHQFTGKLPLIIKEGETPLLGYDTDTAIRSGTVQGIIFEIEGYIRQIQKDYPDLLIFLTGGDTFYFDKRLKNIIFADEYLISKGLNSILQYNAK
jgi:type III pantothenate kinase